MMAPFRNFEVNQIYTNEEYLKEIELLKTKKAYKLINTYLDEQIFTGGNEIKLGYLNINSLVNKIEDVDEDKNLSACDVLVLSETRLSQNVKISFKNWKVLRFDFEDKKTKVPHLGLALLSKKNSNLDLTSKAYSIKLPGKSAFQYLVVKLHEFGLKGIMYYINRKPSQKDIAVIVNHFKKTKVDFFIGDLNLNYTDPEDRKIISKLTSGLELKSILYQSTRSKAHLDHVMIPENFPLKTYATSYSNLYTDHAAVSLRVCKDGQFDSQFVEDQIRKQELNYLIYQCQDINEGKENVEKTPKETESKGNFFNVTKDQILMKGENFILYETELEKLSPPKYLSDEIINSYLSLISETHQDVFIFDNALISDRD